MARRRHVYPRPQAAWTDSERQRLAQWEACYPEHITLEELDEKRQGILLDDPLPWEIWDEQVTPLREHQQQYPRYGVGWQKIVPALQCVNEFCERASYRDGLCQTCWRTLHADECKTEGCVKKVKSAGYCGACYQRRWNARRERLEAAEQVFSHADVRA